MILLILADFCQVVLRNMVYNRIYNLQEMRKQGIINDRMGCKPGGTNK